MVADKICKVIQERKLTVGDKIPSEFELAKLFHVGRGTIREAEKLLISKNILEIRRGTGTFVSEKQGVVDDPFGFHYTEDKTKLIADLVTIRVILEPDIAFLAAKHVTDAEIKHMEEVVQKADKLAQNHQDFCDEDVLFHTLLAKSSRNTVMPNLIPVIQYGIEWYTHLPEKYEQVKALSYHTAIINALKRHDPDEAKAAMKKHLEYSERSMKSIFATEDPDKR
jgi:DNA-binding FadR family transcriptional regulator